MKLLWYVYDVFNFDGPSNIIWAAVLWLKYCWYGVKRQTFDVSREICYRGQLHNTDSSLIHFVSSGTSREHFGFPFLPVFASPLISSQSF